MWSTRISGLGKQTFLWGRTIWPTGCKIYVKIFKKFIYTRFYWQFFFKKARLSYVACGQPFSQACPSGQACSKSFINISIIFWLVCNILHYFLPIISNFLRYNNRKIIIFYFIILSFFFLNKSNLSRLNSKIFQDP